MTKRNSTNRMRSLQTSPSSSGAIWPAANQSTSANSPFYLQFQLTNILLGVRNLSKDDVATTKATHTTHHTEYAEETVHELIPS